MIKKCIVGIVLGILGALVCLEQDVWVSQRIAQACKQAFMTTYGCSLVTKKDVVSLLRPSLTCEDVEVRPLDGSQWYWKTSKLTLGFSWWQFLLYGVVSLSIHADDAVVDCANKQGFDSCKQCLTSMLNGQVGPVITRLDDLLLTTLSFHYKDQIQDVDCSVQGYIAFKRVDGVLRSLITLDKGSFSKSGPVLEQLHGSLQCSTRFDMQSPDCELDAELSCKASCFPAHKHSFFSRISWQRGTGTASVTNQNHSCTIEPLSLRLQDQNIFVDARVRMSFLEYAACMGIQKVDVGEGDITMDVHAQIDNNWQYQITTNLLAAHKDYPIKLLGKSSFSSKDDDIQADVTIAYKDQEQLSGTVTYDKTAHRTRVRMGNSLSYKVPTAPAWILPAEGFSCEFIADGFSSISGSYQCLLENIYKKNSFLVSGTCSSTNTHLVCQGAAGTLSYDAKVRVDPYMALESFSLLSAEGQPLISVEPLQKSPRTKLRTCVEVSSIRHLCEFLYDQNLQAAGKLMIDADYDAGQFKANIKFTDGSLCLPHIYNVIHGAQAQLVYDTKAHTATLTNGVCLLHKGSLHIDHAVGIHDSQGAWTYWYLPMMIKNGLITSKQNFFAHVSGYLVASYTSPHLPHVKADLLLERSFIKENIFSDTFQKRLAKLAETNFLPAGPDATCDIKIETIAPTKVQTPFLEADARMSLLISNTARNPLLTGQLILESGNLLFPYRPLRITKGVITMSATQQYDPLIELIAQNQVRNHAITMHVTGSLLQHHFMFESVPALTEEQIIALLLVGSQEESLNIVMPTLIMQNLASLVFGNTHSCSMLEYYFKRFIQPFKGIHIVPRFTDQSSRGGLRGAIDIEVNDRWRAMIQKNFNLTEDTRFELEYQATDDISVRAIRDEHRDMGAEVEMRWKF